MTTQAIVLAKDRFAELREGGTMTTDPTPSPATESSAQTPEPSQVEAPADATTPAPADPPAPSPQPGRERFTRASAAWFATGAALVLLILLIIFIAQNSARVDVHFLGWNGSISLGLALLIAAVGGGVLVAITGVTRVTQLRFRARRARRSNARA